MPVSAGLVVTCEHASNSVPRDYLGLFSAGGGVLKTHQAFDPGTQELGRRLSRAMRCPLIMSTCSRLLVEVNRSLHHRALFSPYSRVLSDAERRVVLDRYYFPHRRAVEQAVRRAILIHQRVIHLSVHSFTPRLNGRWRKADVGLLYDPYRRLEREFCDRWLAQLSTAVAGLSVRRNYPYRGWSDGLTTHLRSVFRSGQYQGIELEVNQKFPLGSGERWRSLQRLLVRSLKQVLRIPTVKGRGLPR